MIESFSQFKIAAPFLHSLCLAFMLAAKFNFLPRG
jgi:hypothetical protein